MKKKDFPKDSLVIYDIKNKVIQKIPNVKSYKLPEKWSGIITYQLEAKKKKDTAKTKIKDTTKTKKKLKKVSKENGFHLVIRQLANAKEDTIKYVLQYSTYATSGEKEKTTGGVYRYNVDKQEHTLLFSSHSKTKYPQLNISELGKRVGFVVDADSTFSNGEKFLS